MDPHPIACSSDAVNVLIPGPYWGSGFKLLGKTCFERGSLRPLGHEIVHSTSYLASLLVFSCYMIHVFLWLFGELRLAFSVYQRLQ